ncbi:MAG TPA: MmgE/PrpD family protein, partial [Bacillales bacterium]|nr:MmgE/PrpD family protein [Bacillales bacterium]
VAIGYEVCYRIGEAVTPSHYYYWHNTATCGTFGAAAAVAKLLRLNEEQIIHTLGNAGTQAAGLWEFIEDGAMSKQLHPAKAAYNGVISAVLAEKGFTAARKILEGDRGFFQAMSEEPDAGKVTDQLGKTFKIMENSFKIHASCRHTHAVVDLVLDYIREGVKADDLKEIRIQTYKIALDITDNPAPNTVYAAKFSIQYCAALAFTLGSASLSDFNEDHLFHPDVRHLMEKVHVSVSDKMEAAYPKDWGAIVEILLADGRRRSKETRGPKGDPENPVSAGELKQKFSRLALPVLGKQTEAAIERILNLENDRVVSFM